MANNYKQLGANILEKVGGKDNVVNLVHCATRLRFNLRDEEKADTEAIKAIDGVLTVINQGGQFQVVIGGHVKFVYQEIMDMLGLNSKASGEDVPKDDDSKKGPIAKVLDNIAGMFIAVIPALTGAGMVKAILSIAVLAGWMSKDGQTYQFLNFIGDTTFYFLPVLLASSAAKKFNTNPYIAMSLGAALIHPSFIAMVTGAREAGTSLSFFGLPVALANYASSVIPIILSIWAMSYIEKVVDRYMPNVIRMFGTPALTILLTAPLMLAVIAPIGNYMGVGLAWCINLLEQYASWLVPTVVGAFTPLLVMTGMHYGLIPIGINMLATQGVDTVAGPGMTVSNIAQGGAALAVSFKTKDANQKGLSVSTGIQAVLGITEPALYGVNMKLRYPLYAAMLGGGLGGLYMGIFHVGRYIQVGPGLLALPAFVGENGLTNFIHASIASALAFIIAFVISFVLGGHHEKS